MANQAYRPVDPAHLFVLHIREAIRESRSDVKVTLFSGNVIHARSSDVNDARLTFLRTMLAEAHSASVTAQREERRSMASAKTARAESAGAGSVEVRCNEPPVEKFTPELESWLKRLLAHIRRSWFVPHERLSTKGSVRVRFVIHKDGRLTDLALHEASGVTEFNNAALSAVAAANPTEPLPPQYSPPTLLVCLTFEYNAAAK